MALPVSNGLFRTFSNKMIQPTDLISSSTSPTNNSSTRSRLSFSVDSLLSRKQVVEQHVDESDENDSDESVDVEDTSSEIDEKASPSTSPRHLPTSHRHNNNNDDNVRPDVGSDESFKESPVIRHPPFLAGIVAVAAAAAAAAANSGSTTTSTTTPTSCPPHLQPWPSPGPGYPMGLPGLRHPMFPKPGGKLFVIYFCQND
jgi:hypothetical protein